MNPKDVKFINQGKDLDALTFDVAGFAINPADGTNAFFGADFRNVLLTVVGTGTVFVLGSEQRLPPDFSVGSTIQNTWAPIVTADYSVQNTYYDGTTGVIVAGETKIVELNTNMVTWFAIFRSVDTVDVLATVTNNA